MEFIENVRLSDDGLSVIIIDQTLLPGEEKCLTLSEAEEFREAIITLRVRGAPAIGIFAAYALYVLAKRSAAVNYAEFYADVARYAEYLDSARPTAVNLSAQLKRMVALTERMADAQVHRILDAMRAEAVKIHEEDIAMCKAISENGFNILRDGMADADNGADFTRGRFSIMTICNAGPLATSRYGTALGPILLGHERGMKLHVFCCETRPLLQGARLTAFELSRAGVDCTLICDSMAGIVMKEGKVGAVFVGCDRIARNGDTANKVGTGSLAVLAKHYGIPFYVFGPSSTLDPDCGNGAEIEIELRPPGEIKEMFFCRPVAPEDVKCYNPSFDVTDSELITAIVTEKGVFRFPYSF